MPSINNVKPFCTPKMNIHMNTICGYNGNANFFHHCSLFSFKYKGGLQATHGIAKAFRYILIL